MKMNIKRSKNVMKKRYMERDITRKRKIKWTEMRMNRRTNIMRKGETDTEMKIKRRKKITRKRDM